MAMIGRNAAVAEVGKHRHQVEGPLAFAAWLGVHAMLLSGVHSKVDTFLAWGWDYFDRDHAATWKPRGAGTAPGPTTTRTPRTSRWTGRSPRHPRSDMSRHGRRTQRDHMGSSAYAPPRWAGR